MAKIIVHKFYRNGGYSFGLEYPFIYGRLVNGIWAIWHRKTGEVVWISKETNEAYSNGLAMKTCEKMNGLCK